MDKDQAIGWVIFLVSVAAVLIYGYLLITPPLTTLVLQITAFVAVGLILGILAWIGWTMATTPPPAPIEGELPSASGEAVLASAGGTLAEGASPPTQEKQN